MTALSRKLPTSTAAIISAWDSDLLILAQRLSNFLAIYLGWWPSIPLMPNGTITKKNTAPCGISKDMRMETTMSHQGTKLITTNFSSGKFWNRPYTVWYALGIRKCNWRPLWLPYNLSDSPILGAPPSSSTSLWCRRSIRLISRDPETGCGYVCIWAGAYSLLLLHMLYPTTMRGDVFAVVWACGDYSFVVSLMGVGFGSAITVRYFWANGSRREPLPLFLRTALSSSRLSTITALISISLHWLYMPTSAVLFPVLCPLRPLCVLGALPFVVDLFCRLHT